MQFSIVQAFAIVATLLSVAQTAPVSTGSNSTLDKRAWIDDCGGSTFFSETSTGSPRVSDCQQLVRNIAGGGTWQVSGLKMFQKLASYGTCAFGAQVSNGAFNNAHIGNSNISDLINDSISKFQSNGVVGSNGGMSCQASFGSLGVTWRVYHN